MFVYMLAFFLVFLSFFPYIIETIKHTPFCINCHVPMSLKIIYSFYVNQGYNILNISFILALVQVVQIFNRKTAM